MKTTESIQATFEDIRATLDRTAQLQEETAQRQEAFEKLWYIPLINFSPQTLS